MQIQRILILVLLLTFLGCAKTPVLEASESVVGNWIHFSSETEAHRINISADGTGNIEWLLAGDVTRATKIREWYLDDNTLSLGKVAFNGESYEIEAYPDVAWEEMVHYYDTIPELSRYMILDGLYYVETD